MSEQDAFSVSEKPLEAALRHTAFPGDRHSFGGGERAGQFRQHCEL